MAACTVAIRFSPPTFILSLPTEVRTCRFDGIQPGASALDLLSFLTDEGFLHDAEGVPEERILAMLDALIKQRPVQPRKVAAALDATGASVSDDFGQFGDVAAAAALQASGDEDDQFDADDLF